MNDKLNDLETKIAMEKRRVLQLKLEKEKCLDHNKLAHFVPNTKQEWFFDASDRKRRAGFCGNRFGKSTVGVAEDCSWALGYRPFFDEGDPRRYANIPEHGVKGLVLAEDWDKVHEIFTDRKSQGERRGKFFQFLPPWTIDSADKNSQGTIDTIYVKSEIGGRTRYSTICFDTVRSYKSNPAALESSDWDFIHVDEPIPRNMWNAVSRGLVDRGGSAWWLMTALKEVWMYYYITENEALDPKTFWSFTADMSDNPLNSPSDIALFLSQLDEDERDCRQKGIPLAFGNLVYGGYKKEDHLVEGTPKGWTDATTPPSDHMITIAIDTHPQTPHAVLFCAVSPNGIKYFYDEIFQKGSMPELSLAIKQRLRGRRAVYWLCEPAAWNEDQTTGRCYAHTLWECGIPVERASKDKMHGIIQTKDIWTERGAEGEVMTYVLSHMGRFLFELKNYVYDKENKPVDKDDHMMECLYRTVCHDNLVYHNPEYKSRPIGVAVNFDEPDMSIPDTMTNMSL